ncbi:MAG: hypothetical protein K2V38_28625, partial [Gemmataceae bacterium]|nr:hypothetical protein [Gemmataceae bacterium]
MANPNPPPEPNATLTAAELRRRLLASTPPPMAAAVEPLDELAEDAEPPAGPASSAWNPGPGDLLARLRMPGKSGPMAAPPPRSVVAAPQAP